MLLSPTESSSHLACSISHPNRNDGMSGHPTPKDRPDVFPRPRRAHEAYKDKFPWNSRHTTAPLVPCPIRTDALRRRIVDNACEEQLRILMSSRRKAWRWRA